MQTIRVVVKCRSEHCAHAFTIDVQAGVPYRATCPKCDTRADTTTVPDGFRLRRVTG